MVLLLIKTLAVPGGQSVSNVASWHTKRNSVFAPVRGTRNGISIPDPIPNTRKFFIMEKTIRRSYNSINKIYFFSATIHEWRPLLEEENKKILITDYLRQLTQKQLITVYAFVIMPNHIHLIWQQNKLNGKETPQASFLKYTAHEFLKMLKANGQSHLYEIIAANKKHEIWQRDPVSIEIYSRQVAIQKLQYIHFNPVTGKWKLAKDDISYYWSSAVFYETGIDSFGFLSDIYTVFDYSFHTSKPLLSFTRLYGFFVDQFNDRSYDG